MFKQVFQSGMETTNSFGDQEFRVSVNGVIQNYMFQEGEHVDIETFINDLRFEVNHVSEASKRPLVLV